MDALKLDDDSYVRRLLSFQCFAVSAYPDLSKKKTKPWDFEVVRKVFVNWTESRDRSIIEISKELDTVEPGSDEFVWYHVNKNKFAGIILLYSIIGFYKSKSKDGSKSKDNVDGKKDKHADLIANILTCISDGTYPTEPILDEINLTYYWNNQVMGYYAKALELKDMTDDQFEALPEQVQWLNTQ